MLKVAYLLPNFGFIGAQRGAAAVIRAFDKSKFKIIVFVIQRTKGMEAELPEGTLIVELGEKSIFKNIRFLRILAWPWFLDSAIRKYAPDIVVGISGQANYVLVFHRLFFGWKVVFIAEEHIHLTTVLTRDPKHYRGVWKLLYLWTIRRYNRLDALRCVSDSARHDFVNRWGIYEDKAHTLYPAFDINRIRVRADAVQRGKDSIPVLCAVGRLTSQKNFALLIQSFRLVRDKVRCRLCIAGTGPEGPALQRLIEELELGKDVELLGFVEFAEQVIAASDIFVMTSVWEGFPAVLIEAMALGTPVVSVNCESGPEELIRDGIDGCLVRVQSASAVASRIIELLNNDALQNRIREGALQTVEKYSLEAGALANQRLFLEVVRMRRAIE
jgi:glycosyltransferase involved in cell wall biosynthesis